MNEQIENIDGNAIPDHLVITKRLYGSVRFGFDSQPQVQLQRALLLAIQRLEDAIVNGHESTASAAKSAAAAKD